MPIRGGSRNNSGNAGLGALNLNNVRGNSNTNIGFRPALLYRQKRAGYCRHDGARRKGSLFLLDRMELFGMENIYHFSR